MARNPMVGVTVRTAVAILAIVITGATDPVRINAQTPPLRGNQAVAQAIAQQIAHAGLSGYDIEVRYKDEQVSLKGVVGSEEDLTRLIQVVKEVAPTSTIDSRLTIRSSDEELPDHNLIAGIDQPPLAVDAPGNSATEPSADAKTKQQKRNTIILAMLVAGIALTGLLLVIVAIVVRGFLRKMARQSAANRRAELSLPPDVAAAAASPGDNVDESIPFSERETEVT